MLFIRAHFENNFESFALPLLADSPDKRFVAAAGDLSASKLLRLRSEVFGVALPTSGVSTRSISG